MYGGSLIFPNCWFKVSKPSIQLESTASTWNILATFTRRKLSRALERETAFKRGGGWEREALDQLEPDVFIQPSTLEADEILADLNSQLSSDQTQLLDLMLENATQREIAERLKVDERTVRWFVTNASHAVITPVDPFRPVPTQLSLSLTRTTPANLRFACFWLAATSVSEQSVPPPPYFANRSAMLRIESFGSILAS